MKLIQKWSAAALLVAAPLLMAEDAAPVQPAPKDEPKPVETSAGEGKKADNTARNVRERSETEKTPVNQNENKADLEITRKIRRAIVEDKSLSTYAHNIKIITQDGMVDLKGPVRSADEKSMIEAKAAEIAGKEKVKSQLEVAPKDEK
ncbi:MAG TPA: BON domain-containing protein [Planctomycetota bacterium]|nr:BON domain-containing protein [Planctomycetota bacterium]